jgi:UDP-2-acetamido-2,6-beta-L-arabino-hexul-4-ose reductase
VIDIPPGYTHSIENIGRRDMIVLFWAGEIFNPGAPDTFGLTV